MATAQVVTKPTKATKVKDVNTEKPVRKVLPKHPSIGSTDPNVYPLKAIPTDYDADKYAPLKKKDFADDATWFDYKALLCDRIAAKYRRNAEEARAIGTGSGEDKKLLKKMVKQAQKLQELKILLGNKGADVNALIEKALANVAAIASPANVKA